MSEKDSYKPNESQIAIAFVDYVRNKYPYLLPDLIKIDNENKCSPYEGRIKKLQNKIKGASDYFFAKPVRQRLANGLQGQWIIYSGLWIELKTHAGKETKEQKEFGQRMIQAGYQYKCCKGLDETIEEFENYLSGKP